jgi:hypothetical protein
VFPEAVAGLAPGTEYAACLVVTEAGKTEPAVSASVSFKTRATLETPETSAPTEVTSTGATFEGVINPHSPSEQGEFYSFVYQQEGSECRGESEVAIPVSPLRATTKEDQHASVAATGLLPRTTYTYCVLVSTEFGELAQGAAVTFSTPTGTPTVSNAAVDGVSSIEATVSATVDPGGAATVVEVEGPGIASKTRTLPASKRPVFFQQRISALHPATTYVIHVTSTNEAGKGEAEVAFTTSGVPAHEEVSSRCANKTFVGFSFGLPDCRAAELVSAAGEPGEVYAPGGDPGGREENITTPHPFRAAAEGNSVTYLGDPGLTGGDGGSSKGHGNQYLASRDAERWSVRNITPTVGERESVSFEHFYQSFSPDLSAGTVRAGRPLLAVAANPQAPEKCATLYSVNATVQPAAFSSLISTTLSPGFCGLENGEPGADSRLFFAGETPDHTVRVFDSSAALVAPAVPSPEDGGNIYASSPDGTLKVINVLPNGVVEPAAVAGGPSEMYDNAPDLSDAVAPAGNRVIWSSVTSKAGLREHGAAFPVSLYARDEPLSPAARTIQLDEATSAAPGTSGEGKYWTSAANGDKVFFTDCHRLTQDATAHEKEGCQHLSGTGHLVQTGADLYMYDFSRAPGERLVDLSVDHDGADSQGADVQGVIGTSETGDTVYLVAGGALGAGPNARGETPQTGRCETPSYGPRAEEEGHVPAGYGCNLFELHYNGTAWETPKFIATLAIADGETGHALLNAPEATSGEIIGDWVPNLGSRTAEVTPNGGAVVFSSTQQLTGYDAANAGRSSETNGQGANEIFLFNAVAGSLTCVSCDPHNRPPDVEAMARTGFETYLPISSSDTFMHRWVNSAGTEVYFDSSQRLVEADRNETQDVYEWSAEGTPSCPVATSLYGGCVFLLTSGESQGFSFLVDTDESGANVFVEQRGPLYGQGPAGTKSELYDLRASGGQPPRIGTGCSQAGTCPAAPELPSAASAPASNATSGRGNFPPQPSPAKPLTKAQRLAKALKACRARHRRSHHACERQAYRRYRPAHKPHAAKAGPITTTHERRK